MKFPLLIIVTLIFNSNILSQSQKEKEFKIFNNRVSLLSPIKPLEEDAKQTISGLASEAYVDIKKYTFLTLLKKGQLSITISELKEAGGLDAKEFLNTMVEGYKNSEYYTVNFGAPISISNSGLEGYEVFGRTKIKEKESSFIHISFLTDKKFMFVGIGVYEISKDKVISNKILSSLKIISQY